ncbi:MAG: 50S ribosomal protein L14e [Zestosphaera tikiterensis]|uniref:Large ribosomal subunit protein eL14 n=1 Tax=Zestosphaera tikiterensis TaxID=1973259 RepID=A0A2R7Y780_9CREN|nr:MAG: 50S ribosomal protein L14e [Zestosphaera tikiterensis]
MAAIEVGRICVKLYGREAGRKCVIVDIIDENYVLITGPKSITGVKRRRVNVNHIEPTEKKVDIKKGASDEEVAEALKANGLEEFMKERIKISRKQLLEVKASKTIVA